jgi:hypothetical protein
MAPASPASLVITAKIVTPVFGSLEDNEIIQLFPFLEED